jgi:hypothetical protein
MNCDEEWGGLLQFQSFDKIFYCCTISVALFHLILFSICCVQYVNFCYVGNCKENKAKLEACVKA